MPVSIGLCNIFDFFFLFFFNSHNADFEPDVIKTGKVKSKNFRTLL